jgi:hypothetical protein
MCDGAPSERFRIVSGMRPAAVAGVLVAAVFLAFVPPGNAAADIDHVVGFAYGGQGADLRGATVVVRDGRGRRVGTGRTNRVGAFLVRAAHLSRAQRVRIVVATRGGRMLGRRFDGRLVAIVKDYEPGSAIHVNHVTTAIAHYYRRHPAAGLAGAERRVRRALRIPRNANLGSHLRHSTAVMDPVKVAAHIRKLGGHDKWLRHVHRRAKAGKRTRSYAGSGRARAAQGPGAAAMFALNASRSDCNNTGAGKGGRIAGWAVTKIADANHLGIFGSQASNYLNSKDNSCLILAQLAEIVNMLKEIQETLARMDLKIDRIESDLEKLSADDWKRYYSTQASRYDGLRGSLGAEEGRLQKLFDDYEAFTSNFSEITAADEAYYDDLLDDIYETLLRRTDSGATVYENIAAMLTPSRASNVVGLYEGAWRMIRAHDDRFVTQSQLDRFGQIRDYWQAFMDQAATLVTEYWHARGTDSKRADGSDARPKTSSQIATAVHDVFRAGAVIPTFDALPSGAAYDGNPAYHDWDPESQTFRSDLTSLWQGYCGWTWADPGDTERTDVTVDAGHCTTGRFLATMRNDEQDPPNYPSCFNGTPVSLTGAGAGWLPATKASWDALMAAHAPGTTLYDWLKTKSAWFKAQFGDGDATASSALPIAYLYSGDDPDCPYGRAGKPGASSTAYTGPSWYRFTGDRHFTISLYHLGASTADQWLCESGEELNSVYYTCPFHDPQRLAVSMLVRPKRAAERFIPWIPDPDDVAAGKPSPATLLDFPDPTNPTPAEATRPNW